MIRTKSDASDRAWRIGRMLPRFPIELRAWLTKEEVDVQTMLRSKDGFAVARQEIKSDLGKGYMLIDCASYHAAGIRRVICI